MRKWINITKDWAWGPWPHLKRVNALTILFSGFHRTKTIQLFTSIYFITKRDKHITKDRACGPWPHLKRVSALTILFSGFHWTKTIQFFTSIYFMTKRDKEITKDWVWGPWPHLKRVLTFLFSGFHRTKTIQLFTSIYFMAHYQRLSLRTLTSFEESDLFVWFDSLRPLNNLSVMRDGLPGLNQY